MKQLPPHVALFALATVALATPSAASAQSAPPPPGDSGRHATCVDVKIGDEQFYNCLNERLRRLTAQPRFSSTDTTINAFSPAPQVGTFNEAATSERLGSAFGHSVIPQRPPPPVFQSPLVNGR
jgi:hypothetical protein